MSLIQIPDFSFLAFTQPDYSFMLPSSSHPFLRSVAEKVTGNLAQLTSQVAPCDVSSVYGIRKAMGISLPPELARPLIDLTTGKN